jgi:hypothetical protein
MMFALDYSLVFSLSGFFFGILLALIAKEELASGKIYFFRLKSLFFLLMIILIDYLFIFNLGQKIFALLFSLLSLPLFIISLVRLDCRTRCLIILESLTYLLMFFSSLYLFSKISSQTTVIITLLPIIIFIYGLFSGTLLYCSLHPKLYGQP